MTSEGAIVIRVDARVDCEGGVYPDEGFGGGPEVLPTRCWINSIKASLFLESRF